MRLILRPCGRHPEGLIVKRFLTGLFALLALTTATAGPLRDYLRDQRQARESSTAASLDEERDAGSSGRLPEGSRVLRDVAYGADPAQKMDVYLPAHADHAPVILMVHGGAWQTGDKAMSRVLDNKLAWWLPRGYIFVSINYRLLPEADPLVQADDLRRALVFAQQQAPSWGGDPDAFVLMGHSAGAHLVSLVNARPGLALTMGARRWRGAVSLDTAAMDVLATMQGRHYRFYDKVFGKDPSFWREASPAQQLAADAAPLLAVCSTKRPDKPCPATHEFAALAGRMGVKVEVSEQALSHADINGQLGLPGAYTRQVDAFIQRLVQVPR